MTHTAVLVDRPTPAARPEAHIVERDDTAPGPGEAVVDVRWSSINYKDALALTGRPGVLRALPLVPGIDAAGVVHESADPAWPAGTPVIVTGAGLGETRDGGLAERVVVPLDAAMPVPERLDRRGAAAIGTAGFTAALAVLALDAHHALDGSVLVTGARGGVGGFAIALLAARGVHVVASTGRAEEADALRALGAAEVVPRLDTAPGRPLQHTRYSGVVDAVGGGALVNAIAQLHDDGAAAACGLAGSSELPGTVLPFILRGVTLAGIKSVTVARARREAAWQLLDALDPETVDRLAPREVGIDQVVDAAEDVLAGRVRGRVLVRLGIR